MMLARLEEKNIELNKETEDFRKQRAEQTLKWQLDQYQADIEQLKNYQKKN